MAGSGFETREGRTLDLAARGRYRASSSLQGYRRQSRERRRRRGGPDGVRDGRAGGRVRRLLHQPAGGGQDAAAAAGGAAGQRDVRRALQGLLPRVQRRGARGRPAGAAEGAGARAVVPAGAQRHAPGAVPGGRRPRLDARPRRPRVAPEGRDRCRRHGLRRRLRGQPLLPGEDAPAGAGGGQRGRGTPARTLRHDAGPEARLPTARRGGAVARGAGRHAALRSRLLLAARVLRLLQAVAVPLPGAWKVLQLQWLSRYQVRGRSSSSSGCPATRCVEGPPTPVAVPLPGAWKVLQLQWLSRYQVRGRSSNSSGCPATRCVEGPPTPVAVPLPGAWKVLQLQWLSRYQVRGRSSSSSGCPATRCVEGPPAPVAVPLPGAWKVLQLQWLSRYQVRGRSSNSSGCPATRCVEGPPAPVAVPLPGAWKVLQLQWLSRYQVRGRSSNSSGCPATRCVEGPPAPVAVPLPGAWKVLQLQWLSRYQVRGRSSSSSGCPATRCVEGPPAPVAVPLPGVPGESSAQLVRLQHDERRVHLAVHDAGRRHHDASLQPRRGRERQGTSLQGRLGLRREDMAKRRHLRLLQGPSSELRPPGPSHRAVLRVLGLLQRPGAEDFPRGSGSGETSAKPPQ
ncbi:uncharacterized protein LOC134536826 isoform X1 [Bacillus rossius redtenbacheri]|uniref:uncharacterized protein LOC134536826 isoform X1 n=1 Tax=Bacillus rossius redtenbacheri TaxID=93214 RepID=UPI002FDDAC36